MRMAVLRRPGGTLARRYDGEQEVSLMIDNWWSETEGAILDCLRNDGAMSPTELACRIGASDGETIAFLSMLIGAGKVRPCLVEAEPRPRRDRLPAESREMPAAQAPVRLDRPGRSYIATKEATPHGILG